MLQLYALSGVNNGTTATTSSFSARFCPVWATGWTTSRVACGSIPEPSEGRDPSCSSTGHMLPMPFLLCTKQSTQRLILISVTLKIQKSWAVFNSCHAHCPWWVFNLPLNLYNVPVIVLQAPIFDTFYIILARHVTMEDVFFNPTRAAQTALEHFDSVSVVVQRMGLAHYARLITPSFGM